MSLAIFSSPSEASSSSHLANCSFMYLWNKGGIKWLKEELYNKLKKNTNRNLHQRIIDNLIINGFFNEDYNLDLN